MLETELVPPVQAHLAAQGYSVYVNPDGADYFDIVVRRDTEVGLVELKVADWKTVIVQALRRRGWGDWVAVAVPRRSLAEKILARRTAPRGVRVGVWYLDVGEVRVLREAAPLVAAGEVDPFPEPKRWLAERLDIVDQYGVAEPVNWSVPDAGRVGPHRRSSRDWRLEEFPEERPAP
ncbi:MAG: hypothetical protein L3K01_09690 [Thermoplasmata archaeon]|nr:hypothetical protein [Thermoplasmata archaeon]